MISYDKRCFRSVRNSGTGEVNGATIFYYRQEGRLVTATYSGGAILQGHLIALCDAGGALDMRYHHVNSAGELMTGTCRSVPELMADGRLRLYEQWQWTSGDGSCGESIIEEINGCASL
ncbi:MAG: n-acetylglutamate synthase [Chitinophagaceae bacterium]|nr:MAG: n-acetylglutamate synthase [Chitinophagaceae bacterium]